MGNSDEVGNGKSEAVTQVGSTGNPRSISIAALIRDPWSKLIQAAALRNSTNQSHWVADRHTSLKWPAQQHTDLSVRVPATDLSRSVDELGVRVWHTRLTERALILHPWLERRYDWNADELNPSRSHIFFTLLAMSSDLREIAMQISFELRTKFVMPIDLIGR